MDSSQAPFQTKNGALVKTTPYIWKNVAIGGGGFVSAVEIHPRHPDQVYFVTNVGGLFRWDPADEQAIPLTDGFSLSQSSFYSMNGLAFHPEDPDILYIAAGAYADPWAGPGAIFQSTDRGRTWARVTPENWPVKVGGMNYPWVVQRLAVDPNHPEILLYGSNVDGLWRSANGGKNWDRVVHPVGVSRVRFARPFLNERLCGIMAVVFDPRQPGRAYLGAYTDGVYRSDDSGASWERIPDSPKKPFRLAVGADGILWVTHAQGVEKYIDHRWVHFAPSGKKNGYNALAVNPSDPADVLVATWFRTGPYAHEKIYRTRNAGRTWDTLATSINHTVAWLPDADFDATITAFAYNPASPGSVWLSGGYGVYHTGDMNAQPSIWTPKVRNLEETVIFDLAEDPAGRLVSAIADLSGFVHTRGLDDFPRQSFMPGDHGLDQAINTYSLDIAYNEPTPGKPARAYRAASQFKKLRSGILASTDGGETWQAVWSRFTIPFGGSGYPFQLVVSPSDRDNLVAMVAGGRAVVSTDGGQHWRTVHGLPKGITNRGAPFSIYARPLTADGEKDGVFYYYHAGQFYSSDDQGQTFHAVNTSLPAESQKGFYSVQTVPGRSGKIWLNLGSSGLLHSTDHGLTWTAIPAVQKARLMAVGKSVTSAESPAIYIYGDIGEKEDGIFRSTDDGETWEDIQDPENPIGNNPTVMLASRKTSGLLFIGTFGRGIFYAMPG